MERVLAVGDPGASRRIVLLHGHAGSPEAMLDVATALHVAAAAQVLLPRRPLPAEDGWAWWRPGSPVEAAAVDAVRSLTGAGPSGTVLGGFTVLAGFSQGGALALLVAATSPAIATGLVVVAGFVPDELEGPEPPGSPAPALPPVLVLHGEHDEAVDPMHGRRVARWCERAGAPEVELVTYEAEHDWVPETTTALFSWLERR